MVIYSHRSVTFYGYRRVYISACMYVYIYTKKVYVRISVCTYLYVYEFITTSYECETIVKVLLKSCPDHLSRGDGYVRERNHSHRWWGKRRGGRSRLARIWSRAYLISID